MNMSRQPSKPRSPRPSARRSAANTYYRAGPSTGDSPFQKREAPRSARKYFFGLLDIILLLIILAGLGYSLVVSPHPKVIVNSQSFHRLSDYQVYADQLFSRVGNRNKITFNQNSIAAAMQKRFPEIASIDTELPIFSEQPTMRIRVAQASLRVASGGEDYVVDSQGTIVALASRVPGSESLPQLTDQSGFRAGLGRPLLNSSAVSFIKTVVAETKAAQVPVSKLTLPPVAQELDLNAKDQIYYVKFYLGGDALTQTGQYLSARKHFDQAGQGPSQYLDVRIAGRIFYK